MEFKTRRVHELRQAVILIEGRKTDNGSSRKQFCNKGQIASLREGVLMFEKILIPLKTHIWPSFYENTLAVVNSNIVTSYLDFSTCRSSEFW